LRFRKGFSCELFMHGNAPLQEGEIFSRLSGGLFMSFERGAPGIGLSAQGFFLGGGRNGGGLSGPDCLVSSGKVVSGYSLALGFSVIGHERIGLTTF
jgi:hypothetical protein